MSDNLISLGDRPEEERTEIARAGGIASGIAKRENKQLRTILAEMLSMPIGDIEATETLSKLGLEASNANMMIFRLLGIVNSPDSSDADKLRAIRLTSEIMGELTSTPKLTNVSLAVGGTVVEETSPKSRLEEFREWGDELRRQMMQE